MQTGFWIANVKPLTERIDDFIHQRVKVLECRLEVECLLKKISGFKGVYGIVKVVYKIAREIRELLRGYELSIKPESAKNLFDLTLREVRKNPKLESTLCKCDIDLLKKVNYSFNNFFKNFTILGLKEYNTHKKYDINFCEKVRTTINEIESKESLADKLKIAKSFIKRCENMKMKSTKKDLALIKFKMFVSTYENYL